MSSDANRVGFHIHLPSDFLDRIEKAFDDELIVAQRKWGIKIGEDLCKTIKNNSREQLARKVSDTSRANWDHSTPVTLKVGGTSKKGQKDIHLPRDARRMPARRLVMTRDGWFIDSEDSEKSVSVSDMQEHMMSLIEKWARTAVFYAVGSYANV